MKQLFAVLVIILFIAPMMLICSPPVYRLASKGINTNYTMLIDDMEIISWFDEDDDNTISNDELDTWHYWNNQSLFVSGAYFYSGDVIKRIAVSDGYYCIMQQILVPRDYTGWREILEVPPVFIPFRTTDCEVSIFLEHPGVIEILLRNDMPGSSFGCWNGLINDVDFWRLMDCPKVLISHPNTQHIAFAHYRQAGQDATRVYWLFDFPVVEFENAASEPGFGGASIAYFYEEPVNLTVTLLDGWDPYMQIYSNPPLPMNTTLMISDYYNITQVGEPLVYFLPAVGHLGEWGSWHEPDYSDFKYVPKEEPNYHLYIAYGVIFVLVVLDIVVLIYACRGGRKK